MKAAFIAIGIAFCASNVLAHSGGLNSEGCHNNRKTGDYHCHGGNSSRGSGSRTEAARAPAAAPQQSSGPTCYTGPRGGTYTITKSGRKNYSGC
jgi:hypothetical protein